MTGLSVVSVVVCLASAPSQCMTRNPGIQIDAAACRVMAALGPRKARYDGQDAIVRVRCGG
jgi:hypothetical protein